MKKLFVFAMVIMALVCSGVSAGAIEVTLLGAVQSGTIKASGSYQAQGGVNPYYETQFKNSLYLRGSGGVAVQGAFSGAIAVQEQLQVDKGYGKFETKAGSGTLINTENEQSGETTGILTQNAIGFGGAMVQGISTTSFATADGLTATAEAQGIGTYSIGAVSQTLSGSSDPLVAVKVEELTTFHYKFGPGVFQVQTKIVFPK